MKLSANILFRIFGKLKVLLFNKTNDKWQNYPVIINNFNRLEFLEQQIDWLEKAGMKKIYIIDNASTYPPLLKFYKTTKYTIFKLDQNVGHLALWKTHIFKCFENTYYIYTDPDIVPIEDCPLNAVKYFKTILDKYPKVTKVGFGLKIDDIPDCYNLKEKVLEWEKQYWINKIEQNIYTAKVDTTFALYRPGKKGGWEIPALRTGGDLVARHLPWYIDPENLSENEYYYQNTGLKSSFWYKNHKKYMKSDE